MNDNEFYFKVVVVMLCFLLLAVILAGSFVTDTMKHFEEYQGKEIVMEFYQ